MPDMTPYTWDSILRRLQSISAEHPVGPVQIKVNIMLLDGHPVMWFEPDVARLEPKRSGIQFLGLLCEEYHHSADPDDTL